MSGMDSRQLEYFLAVVDHGGVNRAAAALHLAQPSLSQAIRTLERDLGNDLFHRVGRRLVLTDAGRALIGPARDVVRGLEAARSGVEQVGELQVGRVNIAAMPSQAIEPLNSLISDFTRRHPRISVFIRAALTAQETIECVRTGITELGLLSSTDEPASEDVLLHTLARQRFVLVTPPGGPFAPGQAVRHEQLEGRRLIVGQPGTGMRRLVEDIQEAGVRLTEVVETEHREVILPLVLSGVGLAVLADSWARLARQAGLLTLDLEPPAYLNIALARRKGRLSPASAAFVELALL